MKCLCMRTLICRCITCVACAVNVQTYLLPSKFGQCLNMIGACVHVRQCKYNPIYGWLDIIPESMLAVISIDEASWVQGTVALLAVYCG